MSFDRKTYQREYMREYMRERRAAERLQTRTLRDSLVEAKLGAALPPAKPAPVDRRKYQRRYREEKSAAALAQRDERIRANADAIAVYVLTHMGGVCKPPQDVYPMLTALRLEHDDWSPAVQLLQSQGRARWSTPASLLDRPVLLIA